MSENKKYYWLKLQKDFFKRNDIVIIEAMPNGKDYILFYLKLMLESLDKNGELRFSDTIPYNDQMLATITNTNVDIVRSAIKVFQELKMMEICDDQTIFLNEVQALTGADSTWAIQKRNQRKVDNVHQVSTNCLPEIDIEIDKDIDNNINVQECTASKSKKFIKPTLEEVKSYIEENNYRVDPEEWFNYYESNGWKVGRNPMKDWKACVRRWNSQNKTNTKPGAGKTVRPVPEWYGKKQESTTKPIEEVLVDLDEFFKKN